MSNQNVPFQGQTRKTQEMALETMAQMLGHDSILEQRDNDNLGNLVSCENYPLKQVKTELFNHCIPVPSSSFKRSPLVYERHFYSFPYLLPIAPRYYIQTSFPYSTPSLRVPLNGVGGSRPRAFLLGIPFVCHHKASKPPTFVETQSFVHSCNGKDTSLLRQRR